MKVADKRQKAGREGGGFTLIELLVVIGIISLLVSVLMPSLYSARESARSAMCLSNTHGMIVALVQYQSDNDWSFPVASYPDELGTGITLEWDFKTVQDLSTGQVKVTSGLLWQGEDMMKIQQCPSFTGGSNTLADPYTGYNYNTSYLGTYIKRAVGPDILPARAEQLKDSYKCAVFGDGQWSGGANKYMRSPFAGRDAGFSGRYAGTQGFRHLGRTSIAFADGHSVSLKQRCTKGYPADVRNLDEQTGFISEDNGLYDLE